MTSLADAELLDSIGNIAEKAGKIIEEIRQKGFSSYRKADNSSVTDADKASEKYILEEIHKLTPHIPAIGEEEFSAGIHHKTSDEFWLIDPLDGTTEFIAGKQTFTVNIGLVRHYRPVLGAVYLPATQELFLGQVGQGAKKIHNAISTPVHVRQPPQEGITVLASRRDSQCPELAPLLQERNVHTIIHIGSSVKFVRIAEGAADFYPRFLPTMEWDTAAPQAIIEAAGGSICPLDSPETPLTYGKPGWKNPSFICSTQPAHYPR
ncbi:3'(2'),5'-bisphosphate nucleotidase CysQ [Entomobacter blattae]|uniref:3'(2'),5'-bisphosphate nucleotidase CysQ n=1 Tax=Entomobacter blattae TaxID=2762277 RepID=A0A7H1NV06_9PROT|nr:3'(2'),5'-bisphosphate nucleotidase CysQ [Entomobacter blattae]QNT79616.1 Inositol monophosphatase family protein [Entomobacter blattae]